MYKSTTSRYHQVQLLVTRFSSLEGDNADTSTLGHDAADTGRRVNSVLVAGRERAILGNLGRAVAENIVLLRRKALLVRVEVGNNRLGNIGEGIRLNEHLSAHARVDAGNAAVEARVVDVACAEADGGQTRVDCSEGVVVVSHAQLALVHGSVVIGVADQGTLPLSGVLALLILISVFS